MLKDYQSQFILLFFELILGHFPPIAKKLYTILKQ